MGMDFNIKPVGAPAAISFAEPAGEAAHNAVATQMPPSQSVTASDVAAQVRNDPQEANAGASRQVIFDRDSASMVYQVVDNRTNIVVRQFPDEAMLRRRAYFRAIDLMKNDPPREPTADRIA